MFPARDYYDSLKEGMQDEVTDTKKEFPTKETACLEGHDGPVLVARFTTDGSYLMTGGKDRTVILWNPHKGTKVKEYAGIHGYEVLDIKITDDNNRFASCGGDRQVFLWDVGTGQVIRRIGGHTARVNCLSFNKDQTVLVTGCYDRAVRTWDLRAPVRDPIQTMTEARDSVSGLVVTEYAIFSSSIDGCLRQYDLRAGKVITDHVHKPITHLVRSHDGNCVLLSCLDNTVRLFDLATGELLQEFTGHQSQNYKVECALNRTDSHVCSGSEDGKIFIWNLVDAKLAHTLQGHSKAVVSLASTSVAVEGPAARLGGAGGLTCLASASSDGTVRVWK